MYEREINNQSINEQTLPLEDFKVALAFLYLQTILGLASDRYLERENPMHRVLAITETSFE